MAICAVFGKGSVEWLINWLHLTISLPTHDGGLHRTDYNGKVLSIDIGMLGALQRVFPNDNRQSYGLKQTILGLSRSPGEGDGQSYLDANIIG